MTTFHFTARAAGKTTYLLDKMYHEPNHVLVVADERRVEDIVGRLTRRCLDDGPPPWLPDDSAMRNRKEPWAWRDWWLARVVTPAWFHTTRGLLRNPKVLIDEIGHVLAALFGDVEAVTGTEDVVIGAIPNGDHWAPGHPDGDNSTS